MRMIRQWAGGAAFSTGCLAWLFYDNSEIAADSTALVSVSLETEWMTWAAVAFAAATVALVAVVIRPQSRVILDLALILTMGACLLRGWELVLVDNQPGSSRWLGIVVYGALTWTIAVCGVMLRRLQR